MSNNHYYELVAKSLENPENADFHELRFAYVESSDYQPTAHYSYQKLQGQSNSATGFEDVSRLCERILEHNPMDLEARILLEFSYEQMDQYDLANKHHLFVAGILDAIFSSGDGRSFDAAWHVVAVAEEYTLLSVMGLKMVRQALVEDSERFFDVLTCVPRTDPEAESIDLYFDITDPYSYLQNMIN